MTDEPVPPRAKSRAEREREERLARALRENLRRRKQQSRAREDAVAEKDRPASPTIPQGE